MSALRRYTALLAFALGSLWRRRGKNIAVALALALVTAAFASVVALTDSLREEASLGMARMPDVTVSRLRGGRPALVTVADAERVRGVEGVANARPRVWGYLYVEGLGSNLAVVGVPAGELRARLGEITDGALPREGEHGWVVLGEGVMRTLGTRTGDVLGLDPPGGVATDLTIAGSFRSASALTTADVAAVDEADARALLGLGPDEATDLAISVSNPDESRVAAEKISRLMPGARVAERRSLARAYDLTYGTRGGFVALALLPALLALLVLAWDRATGLSAEEKREIGVLKSVGWATSDLVVARMTEAILVAGFAGTLGGVSAYAYVFALGAPGLLHALLGWSSLYPAFALTPAASGGSLLAVASLSVVPYVAAAAVPAWRAAAMDPAEVMRG